MAKNKKTGGRTKGTPNRATATIRDTISTLLSDYQQSGRMSEDFLKLEPRDRLIIAERLMNYVAPKMQATAVDLKQSETDSLTARLIALSNP